MSHNYSLTDIQNINPDEVSRCQENKRSEIYTKLDANWKMTIKEQIENEINRRVREALDTPPLERIKRHQQEATLKKSQQENHKLNLNSHIKFDSKERSKYSSNSLVPLNGVNKDEKKAENRPDDLKSAENLLNGYNKFEYWMKPPYEPKMVTNPALILRLSESANEFCEKTFRTGLDAAQNFGSLSDREREVFFSTFTKNGYMEAIRTGRLPDGSKLQALSNGEYKDIFGVIRDKDGPFWPKDIGPLHPTPHHKRINSEEEPLFDAVREKEDHSQVHNNTKYTALWKHMQIVYDSETSNRNQKPFEYTENVCPSLIFESRFESGNLRRARRIGQFEYELVLNCDLYTKRHTQWFYFRVQNMQKNITYKFIIINLLKPSSLYMQGMRILMYSERSVQHYNIGWHRTGHHIRYSRNFTHLQCPLLNREMAYYQLEFQLEFLYSDDTCYLSHCYPYTYTDLKHDLKLYQMKPFIQKEILCETNIGNSCFLITITDKNIPDREKLGAVITARVHPGETNSSWMMNGLIQYLISDCETATDLRKRVVFKIVPMLNPDGVIVGNYRCSIAGRDLNRNYRFPKEERFPTVYHTKKLMESLKDQCIDVVLYCDLHGHSRKHNVFMYGCDSQYLNVEDVNDINPVLNVNTFEEYIKDRIFPFLMQQNGPDVFSFSGCHFKIHKCKESTGRVVMWKQFNIKNSYTLETAISGTDLNSRRHFTVADLENIGKILSESLFSYIELKKDEKKEKQVGLELLKTVLKQFFTKSKQANLLIRKLTGEEEIENEKEFDNYSIPNKLETMISERKDDKEETGINFFIENLQIDDIKKMNLNLQLTDLEEDSSSTDSDSESQPEEINEEVTKNIQKTKKRKKKSKTSVNTLVEISAKKSLIKKSNQTNLPLISNAENSSSKFEGRTVVKILNPKLTSKLSSLRQLPLFISKYEGRSNGGIPCFTEERVLERARRKSLILIKRDLEESLFTIPFQINNEDINKTLLGEKNLPVVESSENIAEQYSKLQKQSDQILQYRLTHNSINPTTTTEITESLNEKGIPKPVIDVEQIKEMSLSKVKKPFTLKNENGSICKFTDSDGPIVTVKEANNNFTAILKRKIKQSSQRNFCSRNKSVDELPTNDYIKWLNKHYKKIFSQI